MRASPKVGDKPELVCDRHTVSGRQPWRTAEHRQAKSYDATLTLLAVAAILIRMAVGCCEGLALSRGVTAGAVGAGPARPGAGAHTGAHIVRNPASTRRQLHCTIV